MTNREKVEADALSALNTHKTIICELATGYGKSKLAITLANKIAQKVNNPSILLLVAKSVHKENWREEITKWGGLNTSNLKMECYESLKKHINKNYDIIIADEAHHLYTENRLLLLSKISINHHFICLSATIQRDFKHYLNYKYNATTIKVSLQEAILNEVLPEPKIVLIPLHLKLDNTEIIIKNPNGNYPVLEIPFSKRWSYMSNKNIKNIIHIKCSQQQYYLDLNKKIDYYKRRGSTKMHLKACTERLKYLSEIKEEYVKDILLKLKDKRTLTFCSSIAQTEKLGKHCINSKNKKAQETLNAFNEGKIKHITSCQMLNEGVNLFNCQYGIYANINASDRINKQKFGRLLRHKEPIIIIPYYVATREEEIVKKMLEEYNDEYISVIHNLQNYDFKC